MGRLVTSEFFKKCYIRNGCPCPGYTVLMCNPFSFSTLASNSAESSIKVLRAPAEKIVEASKEGNFDLIVMGSRGLGGVAEFLLGSVADRVADLAQCPVVIVK